MKKYSWILALLLALTMAFVFVGCKTNSSDDDDDGGNNVVPPPPGPVDGKYTVTFDPNGGSFDGDTDPISVQVDAGKAVGAINWADDPEKGTDIFGGWFDGDTEYTSATLITKTVTLKAKWTVWPGPAVGDWKLALGAYTWDNGASQKGWKANGNDGNTTDLEWEDVIKARYLVIQTKSTNPSLKNFGGFQIVLSGSIVGGWTTGVETANVQAPGDEESFYDDDYDRGTDRVWVVFDLISFGAKYKDFIEGTAGKFLIAYYTPDLTGLAKEEVYLTNKDLSSFIEDDTDDTLISLYSKAGDTVGFVTKADLGFAAVLSNGKTVTFDANGGSPDPGNVEIESGGSLGGKYPDVTRYRHDFLGWFDGSAETITVATQNGGGYNKDNIIAEWGTEYEAGTTITTNLDLTAGWLEQIWPADPTPTGVEDSTKAWTVVMSGRTDLTGAFTALGTTEFINTNATGQLEIGTGGGGVTGSTALKTAINDGIDGGKKVTLRMYGARPATAEATGNWGFLQVLSSWGNQIGPNVETPNIAAVGTNIIFVLDYEVTAKSASGNYILNPMAGVELMIVECWVEN